MSLKKAFFSGVITLLVFFSHACLATLIIPIYRTQEYGAGQKIGTIKADDTIYGVIFTPNLKGLSPGLHGFHIHNLPLCGNHGDAAGKHLDPVHTDLHAGPYRGNSHLGDLPVLIVDSQGRATLPVLAPRLKLENIKRHSLMIHAKGDNYTAQAVKDNPRVACGVIPSH